MPRIADRRLDRCIALAQRGAMATPKDLVTQIRSQEDRYTQVGNEASR